MALREPRRLNLFFDRSLGTTLGRALQLVDSFPATVHLHDDEYAVTTPDTTWLADTGDAGWFACSQDYQHHLVAAERLAIEEHAVGLFYLWGADETSWEKLRAFAQAWPNIERMANSQPRPFIYSADRKGRLTEVPL